jgi:uncharacterized membrane protein YheB (UPF0754 family)
MRRQKSWCVKAPPRIPNLTPGEKEAMRYVEASGFILISVIIAALIGGITNYLAIKMLFHPRKPIRVRGWKLPFTPGLIPKRKEEIARALGLVVGEYLVTSAGLRQVLDNAEFQQRVAGEIRKRLKMWSEREGTLADWLEELRGEERLREERQRLLAWLSRAALQTLRSLWEDKALRLKPLGDLLPGWNPEKREDVVRVATDAVLDAIRNEMLSAGGDLLVRRLTAQFLEQAGGLFGTLAGIFMDEHKFSAKIRRIAVEQLQSPHVRAVIADMIRKQAAALEGVTLDEALAKLTGRDGWTWLSDSARRMIESGGWLDTLLNTPVSQLRPQAEWLDARVEAAVSFLLNMIQRRMEAIVAALNLPKLVERQVSDFPVERLEQVVLNISGREFRAITWLGALLGGFIGLFQALLLRLL